MGSANRGAIVQMQVQSLTKPDSSSQIYPRKLKTSNIWRHFSLRVWMTAPKSSFPTKVKMKTQGHDRQHLHSPISPITRHDRKKRFLHTKQVVMITSTSTWQRYCDATLNSASFYLKCLTCLNRTFKGIECRPYVFSLRSIFGRFLCFSGCWIGHTSRGKKKLEGPTSMRRLVRELHRVQKTSPNSVS